MGKPSFSDEFKRDAVAQITERGHATGKISAVGLEEDRQWTVQIYAPGAVSG